MIDSGFAECTAAEQVLLRRAVHLPDGRGGRTRDLAPDPAFLALGMA
ncbi:MAG: hypothetical protein V7646_8016 [Pseudonocardia sp.]|jgi:hypothetical protein